MNKCEFSIRHWQRVIRDALNDGYRFYSFRDWSEELDKPARSIILRHDIDVSPELAVRQAREEIKLGVKATYFVRVHGRLYQPETASSRQSLRELSRLGVEIGLHYEPEFYHAAHGDTAAMLAADARLLGDIAGGPVEGCSAHRVGTFPSLDSAVIKSAGLRYDAFTPEFVKERKYISDSARNWREGCLCQWLGKADHLTVLTHPVWWFEPADIKDTLLEQLRRGD
jgi:hypothetical protein